MAAGAILHSLIHNHAFLNGNKRTALVSMLVFLDKNGFLLSCSEDVLFKFVLQLAQHKIIERNQPSFEDAETLATIEWIDRNSRTIEKWERPLPYRTLRKILTEYNCEFERTKNRGSSINIERVVTHKAKKWKKEKTETLKTKIYHGNEGEEVQRNTINKIRNELKLDEVNGIDSKAFYEMAPFTVDDFILIYRKTLDKLARM